MFKESSTYPYRWVVKSVEALLVFGIIFFGLDALDQLFTVEPAHPTANVEIQAYMDDTAPPAFTAYDYFDMALAHQRGGEYAEAIEDYNRVLELDGHLASALLNRGVAYEQLQNRSRAAEDFDRFLDRPGMEVLDRGLIGDGQVLTASMSMNRVLEYHFEAEAGQVLAIRVDSEYKELVDPLIVVVDAEGNPIAGSDDILRQDGSVISMNSRIDNQLITQDGTYTLRVSHAGGGEYGEINISFELD
jgi:hypothetical protein